MLSRIGSQIGVRATAPSVLFLLIPQALARAEAFRILAETVMPHFTTQGPEEIRHLENQSQGRSRSMEATQLELGEALEVSLKHAALWVTLGRIEGGSAGQASFDRGFCKCSTRWE